MSRSPPPIIPAISHHGIRYEAPWSDRGALIAKNVESGTELWRIQVVNHWIDESLELDVQQVWFKSMSLTSANALMIEDERGVRYGVDLAARNARILMWPVRLQFVELQADAQRWRYWVKLTIRNTLTRDLLLDKLSVAANGELLNNLFNVSLDGKEVHYTGPMVKRAPPGPEGFIVLGPGQSHVVTIELSDDYPIPAGEHTVTVSFEHTNHFSPDGFRMLSRPMEFRSNPQNIGLKQLQIPM